MFRNNNTTYRVEYIKTNKNYMEKNIYYSRKVSVSLNGNSIFKTVWPWEFPGCPVVRISCFHC